MQWLAAWAQSPGFGGLAAVVAAVVAYLAARRSADVHRAEAAEDRRQRDRSDRKDQWWARAQWALDLTMSDDSETRTVGYRMLDALAMSEWAEVHEGDVIAAATDRALAPSEQDGDDGSTPLAVGRRLVTRWEERRWRRLSARQR